MALKTNADRSAKDAARVVNQAKSVEFTFDGRKYAGYQGDTVASALYRAGVRVFSRSFKYHRPRGLMCVNGSCPNCLVNVDGTPNVRACTTRLESGMQVKPQNAWPSLKRDILAINDKLDRFLPVGFYYKTFIRPRSLWPVYESVLRHAAGLGLVDPDPDRFQEPYYDKVYRHIEVTVVGGGPAGMSAALAAAELGAGVILVEENPELGGHLRYQISDLGIQGPKSASELAHDLAAAVHAHPHIEVLTGAVAFGWYEGNMIGVAQENRLIKLRTARLVVATGRVEQPLVFHNNDLPGVFLGSGLQRLMNLYDVRPGQRTLVVTGNDLGWQVACDLLDQDVHVALVADARLELPESQAVARARAAGITCMPAHTILEAKGKGAVQGAVLAKLDRDGSVLPGTETEAKCDVIALSTGFAANNALLYQSGCRLIYDTACEDFIPIEYASGVRGAGHAVGTQGLEAILLEGRMTGLDVVLSLAGRGGEAARQQVLELRSQLKELKAQHMSALTGHNLSTAPGTGKKKFVCFCEDVTEKDIEDAVAEGFDDIETLKRYSTISMGPCQGKMCSSNSMRLCGRETERAVAEVGTSTSRPPFRPVKLGVLAGRKLEPVRLSPMHQRHLALGAKLMDAGQWKRPEHYGDPQAEVRAVRERVGLIDVSTLGKLNVQGPDAVRLLEGVYTNRFSNLPVGRIRYGVMCTEEGIVFDDGVVGRLSDDAYYLTTTTGGVNTVYEWLTWWLTSWGWRVHVANVTSSYAAVNLAGPGARDVLTRLTDLDLSNPAFPYMHLRQARVAGVPACLLRIGFVGEVGYEIHVSAAYGEHLWDSLMEAGAEFGIAPFGVEAQRVLRLEKKHIIVGQDTDALSDPFGADLGWVVKLDKENFLSKPSLERLAARGSREQLVGFAMRDARLVPAEGEQIVEKGRLVGRVTSARYSPILGQAIGMGWVPQEQAYEGAPLQIRTQGRLAEATVVCQPFYDPAGERLRS